MKVQAILYAVLLQLVVANKAHQMFAAVGESQKVVLPRGTAKGGPARVMGDETPFSLKPLYTSSDALGGECKFQDFELEPSPLSSTACSEVFKAVHKPTGKLVVLKRMLKDFLEAVPEYIRMEETVQHDVKHKNIGEVYCTMMPRPEDFYMVLPYYAKGDLVQRTIQGIPRSKAISYTRQLLEVVHFLHSKGIGHFDIKLQNMLLDDDGETIKLIDFGFAAYSSGQDQTKGRGTLGYMAPEIFRGPFGRAVDYFAIGRVVFDIFSKGAPPISKIDPAKVAELNHKFVNEGISYPRVSYGPANALIKLLTEFDHEKRWRDAYDGYETLLRMDFFTPSNTVYYVTIAVLVSAVVVGVAVALYFVMRGRNQGKGPVANI